MSKQRIDLKTTIAAANLGDYIEAKRQAKWNCSYKYMLLRDFLGLESDKVRGTFLMTEYVSKYEKRIMCVAFDQYIIKNGYKVTNAISDDGDDAYPFEFENTEVAYKVYKKVVSEGVLFLEAEGKPKLALEFTYFSPEESKVHIYSLAADEKFAETFFQNLRAYAKENNYLKNQRFMPDFSFLEANKNYTWESVILAQSTKDAIQKDFNIILKNLEIYRLNKITFKRGIILKGVPGVGKTLIGKVLCNVAPCTVLWVTPKSLERSSNVAFIGELARELAPTILFLEDIDLYGADRDTNQSKTILGELMNQLDGIEENRNVIVVATTNKGDELEKALRNRPGRFDKVIEIKAPGEKEREEMLKLYTSKFNCDGIDLKAIAENTDGYTGAHVKDLVDLAVMTAIETGSLDKNKIVILKHEHLDKNIKLVGKKKIAIGFGTPGKGKGNHVGRSFSIDEEYPVD